MADVPDHRISPAEVPVSVEDLPLELWEGCTASELAAAWSLPRVDLHRRVGSTNDLARRAADAGAAIGTLVLAEEQTAGRGRVGRTWSSPPGLGLYLSFVARPRVDEVGAYPIRIGLAVAGALDRWTSPDPVQVKWPNDLLLSGRKLGGILCEASWDGGSVRSVVVGIGLNVLHARNDFPAEIAPFAASLREAGRPVSRFEVASRVVDAVRAIVAGPVGATDAWLEGLSVRDALAGRSIEVLEPESGRWIVGGRGAGIAADGALLVDSPQGRVAVRSGSVRFRRSPGEARAPGASQVASAAEMRDVADPRDVADASRARGD